MITLLTSWTHYRKTSVWKIARAALRANISETVLVLLINEQGEKEKGKDEREFSWFCFFCKLG
ncbi:MAG: hypothetical protein ABSA96_08790, partial [Candidatus Acidiferrales bacterium]